MTHKKKGTGSAIVGVSRAQLPNGRPTGRRAPWAIQIELKDLKELLSSIFVEGVRWGAASLVA